MTWSGWAGGDTLTAVASRRDRVLGAATHWRLAVGEQLAGGSRSAVYAVRDERGRHLVLKLSESRGTSVAATAAEAAALRLWAGTGAAAVLVDATSDALLLVRAQPGTPLSWQPKEPLSDTIEIAAALLRRLWRVAPPSYRYPTIADVYAEEERVAREDAAYEQRHRNEPDRGGPGLALLPAAAQAVERLIATTSAPVLLHGDFISKNLLRDLDSRVGYLAIDPQPRFGDPAAEVAAFAAYQPAELILPIAEMLAVAVGVDPRRAACWAAVWATHQTAQAWRDDQTTLEHLVSSPEFQRLLHL